MINENGKIKSPYDVTVFIIASIIAVYLSKILFYINCWPTDSCSLYIPAARRLFEPPIYLSQLHNLFETDLTALAMFGKEVLILGTAGFQYILGDWLSLYPNILFLIIVNFIASLMIYYVIKNFFDKHIGFLGFILYATTFWPYQYVLQGAHQPLVFMNFLLAVYFIQTSDRRYFRCFISGLFLGLMYFSSPTATVYMPYYLGIICYYFTFKLPEIDGRKNLFCALSALAGLLLVYIVFTYPYPVLTMEYFLKVVSFSKLKNNFTVFRQANAKHFYAPQMFRGGGIRWIAKYFYLTMPTLFFGYVASLLFLVKQTKHQTKIWIILFFNFCAFAVVELSQVAQFGRNYFSYFFGFIFIICYACFLFFIRKRERTRQLAWVRLMVYFLIVHLVVNSWIFFGDVLPTRLATTKIYNWLIDHDIEQVYVYGDHVYKKNVYDAINNPKQKKKIGFKVISSISDVKDGYILIPPVTGKSIWSNCISEDYTDDGSFNRIYGSNNWKDAVVAEFKAMPSSRIWVQEEEICAYRDLILNQISDLDRSKGNVWILDAQKLRADTQY
ncbi:MAG: glycosyltransferase family 39 protein [Candidatus Omnitrophica bacterium]|nr:glycosyltransferase family 39 protein [Candidatus Omnitrophota bacterium]